jgi:hypothetical protein
MATVTKISRPEGIANSHGVWQVGPSELLASAPGGSDSIRTCSGEGERNPKLGIETEHAVRANPHAATKMIRVMGLPAGFVEGVTRILYHNNGEWGSSQSRSPSRPNQAALRGFFGVACLAAWASCKPILRSLFLTPSRVMVSTTQ